MVVKPFIRGRISCQKVLSTLRRWFDTKGVNRRGYFVTFIDNSTRQQEIYYFLKVKVVFLSACYIQNRCPTSSLKREFDFEMRTGKSVQFDYFQLSVE